MVPRPDWPALVESSGYNWHTDQGQSAWNESACYVLEAAEIERFRRQVNECYRLYEHAAEEVVRRDWWARLGIPSEDVPIVRASWERHDWDLAGRFDFLLDEAGQPKLLEFNADNALTLLETSIIQREWQRAVQPVAGQFNQLHESLVAAWRVSGFRHVHCAWRPRHREVEGSVRYLARTIREAGLEATLTAMHCLGWDPAASRFVDREGRALECCYKLYPWRWMLREPFARLFHQGWVRLGGSKMSKAILRWTAGPA